MKNLLTFMLMVLALVLPSAAAEPVVPASLKEVQTLLKTDLTSIKHLYMTKLDPKTHADRVNGDGLI